MTAFNTGRFYTSFIIVALSQYYAIFVSNQEEINLFAPMGVVRARLSGRYVQEFEDPGSEYHPEEEEEEPIYVLVTANKENEYGQDFHRIARLGDSPCVKDLMEKLPEGLFKQAFDRVPGSRGSNENLLEDTILPENRNKFFAACEVPLHHSGIIETRTREELEECQLPQEHLLSYSKKYVLVYRRFYPFFFDGFS